MREPGSALKKLHSILKPWYIIALIIFLWWLAARMKIWNAYLLPAPAKVVTTFFSMLRKGEVTQAVLISLRRVLSGFAISFTLAFLCALVSTYKPGVAEYFRYLGNFFRNVPPIAMISLLILWFGLGETPKLIIIVLASFFPMTMNIATGFQQCDIRLLEVGKALNFSKLRLFFRITLPASRMNILTGIRIGMGYSWRALIGAEMFAAAAGLGYMIVFAQQMSRSDKVIIGILLIGMIGAITDVVLRFLIEWAGGSTQTGQAAQAEIPEPDDGQPEITAAKTGQAAAAGTAGEGETRILPGGSFAHNAAEHTEHYEPANHRMWTDTTSTMGEIHPGEIRLEHVTKEFSSDKGDLSILDDVSIGIPTDRITVVLGKSGCGKTTLLRMISGLDQDYEGTIRIPDGKRCAVVFQESRLMPWLRVRDNITFGLKKDEIREEKVAELLDLTGLRSFARTKPAQLSGGMRQRTAIARALAVEPDFLLMDEPFAALDYFTRENMQKSLLAIQKKTGCGILFITHSIDEALILADRILIMGDGTIYKRYQLTADTDTDTGKAAGRELSELKEDILMNI